MKKICLFVYFIIMVVLCISLTSCFLFYDRGYRFASDLVDALDNKDAKYIKESFQKKVNVTDEEVNALFEAYGDEKHTKFSVNSVQSTTGEHGVVDDYYSSRLTIEKESVVFDVTYLWYRTASDGDDGLERLVFKTKEDDNTYKYFINGYSLLSEYSKGLFVLGYNFNFNNLCIETSQMCDNFIKYLDESNIDELNNLFSKKLDNSLIDLNQILEYHEQYKGWKYWHKYLFYFVDEGVEYTCWNMNIYYETIMIIYCHSENKEEAGIQYLKFVKGLISSSKYEKNEVKVGFSIDEEGEKTYFS